MPEYKKVSEFKLDVIFPEATQVEKEEILDKEIVIEDFEVLTGKFGQFSVICFFYAEKEDEKLAFVGGQVITRKLEKIRKELPVVGKITKPEGKRYFDLV